MTLLNEPPVVAPAPVPRQTTLGQRIIKVITTTDHKTIGRLYLTTSFSFFLLAGLMALLMRAELARPGLQFLTLEQYKQLFTMHGAIMLLLFATALFIGFANFLMPLQIGSPDVAFPRLNMLGYWLYLLGGLIAVSGFITPGGAAAFGWFAYTPLSGPEFSPQIGADLWILGLALGGVGTILGAVNFITTILTMRAPGMTMFRMPIFTWNVLLTSVLILMVFPVLAATLIVLEIDRKFGLWSSSPRTAGRSCGSTSSGSSAIPRSTSWRCRSSASSLRSCRSSAASRSSATRVSSSPRSRSLRCRCPCGLTTCTSRAP